MTRRASLRPSFAALACAQALACHAGEGAGVPTDAADASAEPEAPAMDARAGVEPVDAHDEIVAAARAALDAGTWDGSLIGAASMHTSVIDRMEWPPDPDGGAKDGGGVRLGYLRYGAKVAAFAEPFANEGCREGWYELVEGGYVCGKYATFDLRDPRVRLAPAPPNLAAPMPYKYGFSLGHGTPVYRRVLSIADRKKYEPWLIAPPPAPPKPEGDDPPPPEDGSDPPPTASAAPPQPAPAHSSPSSSAGAIPDASIPWFMREHDGGRPPVTLDDLHGRGVLVRRMMRGFFLALDRDFKAAHARWWRTTAGFAVPFERVGLQGPPSQFHGAWVRYDDAPDGGAPLEPNGSGVLLTSTYAAKYTVDPEKKKVTGGSPVARNTAVALTGEPLTIGGVPYQQTTYGWWIRLSDGMLVTAPEAQPDSGPDEKWIDVDTTRQLLAAFEGRRPVFMTLISSGRKDPSDPDKDWTTPPGVYRIREKHVTATMDGDVAADGPYSIEDVPWVMYFQGSYALHAAFWHNAFGHPRSHGCVNMAPLDARELFFWAEPRLPTGWHGVYATEASPGTRVVVHGDEKKK